MLSRFVQLLRGTSTDASASARALARGAVAVGAVVAGRVAQRRAVPTPESLPPAVAGHDVALPLHEGTLRLVVRPGTDDAAVPLLVLPPLTPVSSAAEVAALAERLGADAARTVLTPDWLGFGRSDRPNVRYQSGMFQRHLRRLLTAVVARPCDVVAVGHAAEVAAAVAFAAPGAIRRLVLVAPSGMGHGGLTAATVGRMLLGLVSGTGAFDLAFRARLATREAVRRYYADHVFLPGAAVPDALVDYAARSVRARGASFAPRRIAEGLLSMEEHALGAYLNVRVPTLVVLPTLTDAAAPHYDALADLAGANPHLTLAQARGGWLPHVDAPDDVAALVRDFLSADAPTAGPLPPLPRPRKGLRVRPAR